MIQPTVSHKGSGGATCKKGKKGTHGAIGTSTSKSGRTAPSPIMVCWWGRTGTVTKGVGRTVFQRGEGCLRGAMEALLLGIGGKSLWMRNVCRWMSVIIIIIRVWVFSPFIESVIYYSMASSLWDLECFIQWELVSCTMCNNLVLAFWKSVTLVSFGSQIEWLLMGGNGH